jgi:lipopolysaccharide transport system permease protein
LPIGCGNCLDLRRPAYPLNVDQLTEKPPTADGRPRPDGVPPTLRTIRLQPTRGFSRVLSPSELWRFRELAVQIAARDITVRYRQTVLGALWAILQPLATVVVFSIFFGKLANLHSEGHPYPLFSLAGLVPWTFFANALLLGSDSLVGNSALVAKTYFPRIFIPLGVLAAGIVDLTIATVILLVTALAYGTTLSADLLVVPLLVVAAFAGALGVSSALAAANVRFRDVRYVVPFAVQLWLFLTPVVYPVTLVPSAWRNLTAVNPMVGVVEGFRWAVLGGAPAPTTLMIISAGSAAVLFVLGLAYFDRVERRFADLM